MHIDFPIPYLWNHCTRLSVCLTIVKIKVSGKHFLCEYPGHAYMFVHAFLFAQVNNSFVRFTNQMTTTSAMVIGLLNCTANRDSVWTDSLNKQWNIIFAFAKLLLCSVVGPVACCFFSLESQGSRMQIFLFLFRFHSDDIEFTTQRHLK